VFRTGDHTVTLFGLGYYGFSYMAGLRPIYGFNSTDAANGWQQYPDTIDSRQKDQTHTGLLAMNDVWNLGENQELQLSGFIRTYNLSLFSNFGDGLIRQSEFRTVTGGSAVYRRKFSERFTLLTASDYEREAPRRDNLDHYNFFDPKSPDYYGPFVKIAASNVTISPISPYIAAEGGIFRYFRYYLGWRRDEIFIDNQDLVTPANSYNRVVGLNSPKATLTFFPKAKWCVPEVAVSFGKSFFTEDPRTSTFGQQRTTGVVGPVETARSYQLVLSKEIHKTDLKLTLGRETQTAEYGKIDADTGLQFDLGPGRIRYMAAALRQTFGAGWFQATFEQADPRELDSGQVTPEAPRLIGDLLGIYEKLPFHVQVKGEFEYVGRKVVGNGCNESDPKQTEFVLLRSSGQRVSAGSDPFICTRKNQCRRHYNACLRVHGSDNREFRNRLSAWVRWPFARAPKFCRGSGRCSRSVVCKCNLHLPFRSLDAIVGKYLRFFDLPGVIRQSQLLSVLDRPARSDEACLDPKKSIIAI
jgi:hypothetical protein